LLTKSKAILFNPHNKFALSVVRPV